MFLINMSNQMNIIAKGQTDAADQAPLLLTERQAATWLNLSIRTLYTLRHNCAMPFVRIGSRVMYEPSELREWINARKESEPNTAK